MGQRISYQGSRPTGTTWSNCQVFREFNYNVLKGTYCANDLKGLVTSAEIQSLEVCTGSNFFFKKKWDCPNHF